ncbi:isoprenoid synthase domain-containing protein [Mycena maculata]|uniref:Isoprenoid synthase domain-containing protein n=1 Tax=Mycena maculata TaxID=230809 RepID=A0AAD7JX15_9AGAR|nr:isoprenoid synthase domain-containing protein [Mycena maculata]
MPAQSVQLPDLLSRSRAFDLRTNRHCHTVASASEKWFTTEHPVLTEDERAALRSMKVGLWASVCFPTCDLPQLRLGTDFMTALVICNARLARAQSLRACGWTGDRPVNLASLSENDLFHDVMQRILSSTSSETWRTRFTKSSEAYRDAQMQLLAHRQNTTLPGVETYVELRRDLSGMPMVFHLIEMAEGLKMTSVDSDETWNSLKRAAGDIISLSTDIFAYNNDQFVDNDFNVISIIRAEQGVSIQGAINYASTLIDRAFQSFAVAECALSLEPPVQGPATSAWTWNPLNRKQPSDETPGKPALSSDAKLYSRGLKDCIVGTLNWSYETELYFGSKGDEIRQYGWVFLRARDGGQK